VAAVFECVHRKYALLDVTRPFFVIAVHDYNWAIIGCIPSVFLMVVSIGNDALLSYAPCLPDPRHVTRSIWKSENTTNKQSESGHDWWRERWWRRSTGHEREDRSRERGEAVHWQERCQMR
jgi:hypothetical protein